MRCCLPAAGRSGLLHAPIDESAVSRLKQRYGQDVLWDAQLDLLPADHEKPSRPAGEPRQPPRAAEPTEEGPAAACVSQPSTDEAATPTTYPASSAFAVARPRSAATEVPPAPSTTTAAPEPVTVAAQKPASPAQKPASPALPPTSNGAPADISQASVPPKRQELVLVTPENAMNPTAPSPKSTQWTTVKDSVDKDLKAFAPLDLRQLPEDVQRALAYIRAKINESGIEPSPEMGHDVRLLRFLIGQKWDVKGAAEEYIRAVKKRIELEMDAKLRDPMVRANAAFFNGGDSLNQIYFHPAATSSAELIPRTWVAARGSTWTPILSRQGHLLVADQAPDFELISKIGAKEWHEAELAFQELQMLVLDELTYRSGILVMACKVTDVKGREMGLARSLIPNPLAGATEKQFKTTGALLKFLYPTVVFKWYMVNLSPSYKGKVQTAIENFGGRSKHKMIVCGDNFHASISEEVDIKLLPVSMGGTMDTS